MESDAEVTLGRAVCPGFWFTLIAWAIFLVGSPLAVLAVGMFDFVGGSGLLMGVLASITPFILLVAAGRKVGRVCSSRLKKTDLDPKTIASMIKCCKTLAIGIVMSLVTILMLILMTSWLGLNPYGIGMGIALAAFVIWYAWVAYTETKNKVVLPNIFGKEKGFIYLSLPIVTILSAQFLYDAHEFILVCIVGAASFLWAGKFVILYLLVLGYVFIHLAKSGTKYNKSRNVHATAHDGIIKNGEAFLQYRGDSRVEFFIFLIANVVTVLVGIAWVMIVLSSMTLQSFSIIIGFAVFTALSMWGMIKYFDRVDAQQAVQNSKRYDVFQNLRHHYKRSRCYNVVDAVMRESKILQSDRDYESMARDVEAYTDFLIRYFDTGRDRISRSVLETCSILIRKVDVEALSELSSKEETYNLWSNYEPGERVEIFLAHHEGGDVEKVKERIHNRNEKILAAQMRRKKMRKTGKRVLESRFIEPVIGALSTVWNALIKKPFQDARVLWEIFNKRCPYVTPTEDIS